MFAADIKGDLSGLAVPGEENHKITERAASVGQKWKARGFPVEFYALGGEGTGVPAAGDDERVRADAADQGARPQRHPGVHPRAGLPLRRQGGLPLLDLADLREVVKYLTTDEGKADLKDLGGLSSATAGVILRELIAFSDQGADAFFGEPEFETSDFLRTTPDGKGLISLVELPNLQDRPGVFSTFLMWLLADLFHDLPEVGDVDKPKLVFFFDEAHLLFDDASKAFLDAIAQTVRLIRSKGVGVFFVTQAPTDVPDDVLAQLGSRIQHQLRAATPNDAKALKADGEHLPDSGVRRPRRGDHLPRHRRGDRDGDERARRADPGGLDAAAGAGVADGPGRHRRDDGDPSPRARSTRSTPRPSTASPPARSSPPSSRRAPARPSRGARGRRDRAKKATAPEGTRSRGRTTTVWSRTSSQSGAFKDFMRTAAREIARGMFKTGRRSR